MKRILVLVLALTLCFLMGCKEENPQKPVEKTPVEEIKEPVEETPIEPEIEEPVEEIPIEPEIEKPAEETDENVIILPEPDENTKVITIEFPEDFPEEPYTEPELVSPDEFEWGEYVPFVRYENGRYERHNYFYDYAIITDGTNTLHDGTKLYQKLNSKYQTEEPPIKGSFAFCDDILAPENTRYYDYLFKSRIIHISEDASELGRFSLIDSNKDNKDTDDLFYRRWYSKYELLKDGKAILTDNAYYIDDFSAGAYSYYNYSEFCSLNDETKLYCPVADSQLLFRTEKEVVFIVSKVEIEDNIKKTVKTHYLYSLIDNSLKFVITTYDTKYNYPDSQIYEEIELNQFLNSEYITLNFNKYIYDVEDDYISFVDYYSSYSLYNCNSDECITINNYTEKPIISPDLKYLIYSAPPAQFEGLSGKNNLEKMKAGFYIKNIENKDTVFFEIFDGLYYYVCNWVNKENLFKLIE